MNPIQQILIPGPPGERTDRRVKTDPAAHVEAPHRVIIRIFQFPDVKHMVHSSLQNRAGGFL